MMVAEAEEAPAIHTAKGNLPIASLQYTTRWEDTATYIKLVETYTLGGEVVRESAHIYAKHGMFAAPNAGNFS